MTYVLVHCPDWQGVDVVRYGKQRHGPQRYCCHNTDCPRHIFLLEYRNRGRLPALKQQMVAIALHGSGIRDTARVLKVSPTTVISTLKKSSGLQQVNEDLLQHFDAEQVQDIIHKGEAAEVDEMWSFVGSKRQQRWLWHAIDHHTRQVLAYVFGTREDETFLQLQELLAPFGITHFYTDGWGPIVVTLIRTSTQWGNNIRKRSNANTPRCVPGSNAWYGRPYVFPNPSRCMIW